MEAETLNELLQEVAECQSLAELKALISTNEAMGITSSEELELAYDSKREAFAPPEEVEVEPTAEVVETKAETEALAKALSLLQAYEARIKDLEARNGGRHDGASRETRIYRMVSDDIGWSVSATTGRPIGQVVKLAALILEAFGEDPFTERQLFALLDENNAFIAPGNPYPHRARKVWDFYRARFVQHGTIQQRG